MKNSLQSKVIDDVLAYVVENTKLSTKSFLSTRQISKHFNINISITYSILNTLCRKKLIVKLKINEDNNIFESCYWVKARVLIPVNI